MSEIKFKLKEMVGFDWDSLNDNQREDIIKHIFEFPLVGDVPNRFGFVKCERINENQIYGYFTQELEEGRHRYNDQKKEEKYIDIPFEDFFFILLFDDGLCLLQSRKIKNISMPTVEERFAEALESVFKNLGVNFYHLMDCTLTIGKDEFIRIFNTENILSLKVDSLKGRTIPEDFKIFNPEAEKDSIVRAYFNDDFKHLDEFFGSTNRGGGLQESKLSKTILNTGEPRKMEYIGRDRDIITVKNKIGPSVSLDIDVESPITKDIQAEVKKLFSKDIMRGIAQKNRSKERQMTFYDFHEGKNDNK